MDTTLARTAQTDAPILDVLAERWSTRVFDPQASIDEDALRSALEAARWAPSANNTQPWRFVIGIRGSEAHAAIVDALMGFNRSWAADAAALVVFAANTSVDGQPLPWATYDVGQAAAFFTIQAHASGLFTHQMGGFDRAAIAAAFGFDADVTPITVMAVGALGHVDEASEALRERELAPRTRRPVAASVIAA
jgi:nitroreductase